jgi:hypothetical protein
MDLLEIGTKWLHQTLPKVAAGNVVYEIPGVGSVTVAATRAQRTHTSDGSTGITISIKSPDWIITKSLLVINGSAVTPKYGHLIKASGQVYEVTRIGDGEPPARDSDRYGQAWRIHTQQIDVST